MAIALASRQADADGFDRRIFHVEKRSEEVTISYVYFPVTLLTKHQGRFFRDVRVREIPLVSFLSLA